MITDFKRPTSVEEALTLQKDGYLFLAGGTQINNGAARHRRPAVERVASLDALNLGGIQTTAQSTAGSTGGGCTVGAMITLQELADNRDVPVALSRAAAFIPTRSVRNVATIGGNVGARRPDSYIIPALIALDAVAVTTDGQVPVEQYVTEKMKNLILRFQIPPVQGICHAVKESRSHIALPVVSAAVRLVITDGKIGDARVAVGCVAPQTVRLPQIEKLLPTRDGSYWIEPAGKTELEAALAVSVTPAEDFLGSREYKTYINAVVITDCIGRCIRDGLKGVQS